MVAERLVKCEAESEVRPLSYKALREHAVHPQGKGTGLEVAGWWGNASLPSDQELLPWRVPQGVWLREPPDRGSMKTLRILDYGYCA